MDNKLEEAIICIKEDITKNNNAQFYMNNLIGEGTIARVYKIQIKEIKTDLSLKIIPKKISNVKPYLNFLKNIKKPFFARIYEIFEDENNYYIIMEYYKYNLNYFVKGGMQIKHIFKIIEKLNEVLLKLNTINIIFRNIKPENIFIVNKNGNLDDNFDIILSDSCNIYLTLFHDYPENFALNNYFSPEIKKNNGLDIKSDLWSLGKLIFYMLFYLYIENADNYFEYNFLNCIKYKKLENFLKVLLNEKVELRYNWNKYIEYFTELKNEIWGKEYDDIIDIEKIFSISSNILFPSQNNIDNIIIKLTELSDSKYIYKDSLCYEDFDQRGNRQPYQYSRNQKRGYLDYIPPLGWAGIGLNLKKYENWNIKCGNTNGEGEWCVAYHGTSLSNAKNIIINGLKAGDRQALQNIKDEEGEIIGEGVYFSPFINIAEHYSEPIEGMKCVFMCRVNPKKAKRKEKIYVVNEPDIDVIPYRLLIKNILMN